MRARILDPETRKWWTLGAVAFGLFMSAWAAVLNSARQVGGSIGIAAMGAIIAHEAGGRTTPEAFLDGFAPALVVASLIALAGAALAVLTTRAPRRAETAAPAPEPAT